MNTTDKFFYAAGIVLFAALTVVSVLQNTSIFTLTDFGPPCSFFAVTGYYCPGCGGTHAVCSLAAGRLTESFLYHPVVPYTAACLALFVLWNTAALFANRLCAKSRLPFWHFSIAYVYIGIAILFLQWIVKDLLIAIG